LTISYLIILGIITTISFGVDYAFAETESTNPIITVQMNGPSTFYLDQSNQIIRASVEIQNYTPSDGYYFMKVTHLPTQIVLKDFEIHPKDYGNDLWAVQIAYPFLDSDIKVGDQTLFGEFEIHIRSEFGSQTASTKFSIFEYTYGPESKLVPPESTTSNLISVKIPQETSVPGCEEAGKCYIPRDVTIDVGYTIEWINYDPEAHTVTSITLDGDPSGEFDSGLFTYGKKFSHTFDKSGEFDYFCTVHPWMSGIVIVKEPTVDEPEPEETSETETTRVDDTEPTPESEAQTQIDPPSLQLDTGPSNKTNSKIPDWVKNNAGWWASDQISESEFLRAIEYLIEHEIMTIPETPKATTIDDSQEIPSWIKNNADWWAQGLITDDDFVKGIQYLVVKGIILV